MNENEIIVPKGYIQAVIKTKNGIEVMRFRNMVLNRGKNLLVKNLLEEYKDKIYIANMLFGDGGTSKGNIKEVSPNAEHLNGVVRLKKSVVAGINPESPHELILTVIFGEDECNDFVINEMGLELSDESLFSLATFADFNKTSEMEVTWSWSIALI